ncbi:hypothetical protein GCM10018953_29960 [Streptosporangium nondiastaticum]
MPIRGRGMGSPVAVREAAPCSRTAPVPSFGNIPIMLRAISVMPHISDLNGPVRRTRRGGPLRGNGALHPPAVSRCDGTIHLPEMPRKRPESRLDGSTRH